MNFMIIRVCEMSRQTLTPRTLIFVPAQQAPLQYFLRYISLAMLLKHKLNSKNPTMNSANMTTWKTQAR